MGNFSARDDRPDAAAGVLTAARDRRRAADEAEAELLALAVDWATMHPAESIHHAATHTLRGFGETDLAIAGPGAPTVAEFAIPEFAASVGLSTEAGKRYVGEAVELRFRLPRTYGRVVAGDLPAWRARIVARETIRLSVEAAAYVDRHLAPVAHKVTPGQLDRAVDEAIGRFMPDEVERRRAAAADRRHVTIHDQQVSFTGTMYVEAELDLADALDLEAAVTAGAEHRVALGSEESLDVRRAQAVGDLARHQLSLDLATESTKGRSSDRVKPRRVLLYVHLSEAAVRGDDPVARLARRDSLVSVDQVRAWCGHPDAEVVVQPVLDLADCVESDSDAVPDRIAERVAVRDLTCVFPWCTRPARSCDCDHIVPRARGGPTCTCNIAPLCRRHHRLKTHAPWSYLARDPGTFLWTSPHGYQFLRDATGTLDVSPDRPRPGQPDT
jgi:hypothetical protein